MYSSSIKYHVYQVFEDFISWNGFLPYKSAINKLAFLPIHSPSFFSSNNNYGDVLTFWLPSGSNLTCFVWGRIWISQHCWKRLQHCDAESVFRCRNYVRFKSNQWYIAKNPKSKIWIIQNMTNCLKMTYQEEICKSTNYSLRKTAQNGLTKNHQIWHWNLFISSWILHVSQNFFQIWWLWSV